MKRSLFLSVSFTFLKTADIRSYCGCFLQSVSSVINNCISSFLLLSNNFLAIVLFLLVFCDFSVERFFLSDQRIVPTSCLEKLDKLVMTEEIKLLSFSFRALMATVYKIREPTVKTYSNFQPPNELYRR